MTRGNTRGIMVDNLVNNNNNDQPHNENAIGYAPCTPTPSLLTSIARHWEAIPPRAKSFLLNNLHSLRLNTLAKFWSHFDMIGYTHGDLTDGDITGNLCITSWFLARQYLEIGMQLEARALILNGSFLHQCLVRMISCITCLVR